MAYHLVEVLLLYFAVMSWCLSATILIFPYLAIYLRSEYRNEIGKKS